MTEAAPLPPAALRLRVDRAALAANWTALDALSGAARAGAAIKADCYGLGVDAAVPVLAAAGCRDWFVAHWQEAAGAVRHVPAGQVSVLHGPMTDAEAAYARALGVRPVLNSLPQVRRWLAMGGGACDLMIDTGMSRLGLPLAEIGAPEVGMLEIETCLSHLASADEDCAQNAAQLARFREVRVAVHAQRFSLCNSAGIALGSDYHFDLTRPGLALYGGVPRGELAERITQVAYPEAAVIQVRELARGDSVGYNATFTAPAAMRVGVISVGYADGYLRCWSDRGQVLWQGQQLPVLGRVSMDMTIIDLSAAENCGEGDWLGLDYALPEASAASGLSQYELLTLLGRRYDRAG
ncbi:alanine racemase, biosynthetic [Novosphingobium sediminis]|uniref:alanine racemase n=1 Tax=Novosphingobium sediminis TaxID=707214 RepID=A0A512AFH2_9SPHN|nr:alanine racemase [Novosphingobium sediminis]GEN98448.1 alanine racemase, biosynthetic [Novosphingobium sediminis]